MKNVNIFPYQGITEGTATGETMNEMSQGFATMIKI